MVHNDCLALRQQVCPHRRLFARNFAQSDDVTAMLFNKGSEKLTFETSIAYFNILNLPLKSCCGLSNGYSPSEWAHEHAFLALTNRGVLAGVRWRAKSVWNTVSLCYFPCKKIHRHIGKIMNYSFKVFSPLKSILSREMWTGLYQICTSGQYIFTPSFFAELLNFCQVSRGARVNRKSCHIYSGLYWGLCLDHTGDVMRRYLNMTSKALTVVLTPFLCSFSFIFKAVVLLAAGFSSTILLHSCYTLPSQALQVLCVLTDAWCLTCTKYSIQCDG